MGSKFCSIFFCFVLYVFVAFEHLFVLLCFVAGFLYVASTVLELPMWTGLVFDSQSPTCFCLPQSAGVKEWILDFKYKFEKTQCLDQTEVVTENSH